MVHGFRLLLVVMVILVGTRFASGAHQSRPVNQNIALQKYRIRKALGQKVMSWLCDANDSAALECDALADSLLSLEEPDVSSYLIAAQVASLREEPQKAILMVEDAISKYPEEKAPVGLVLPVKVVGRLWIGTIARHSGDIAKAKNVYETILTMLDSPENIEGLDDRGGVMMICNLYLAEIESLHLKRNDLALVRLKAIERITKPAGQLGAGYDVWKGWAAYQRAKLSRGKAQASQQLVGHPDMMSAHFLAGTQLGLIGITGRPLAGCCGPDKRQTIITWTLADRAIGSAASPIDRSLARLAYGFYHQEKGRFAKAREDHVKAEEHYAEAEKHYLAVFNQDSYFSPVAGIYAGQCRKAQGKTVEADGILEEVRTKYPGYDATVAEIQESWNRNTREDMKDD